MKKVVKKKEMINVPVKVKKTRIEKRYTIIIGINYINNCKPSPPVCNKSASRIPVRRSISITSVISMIAGKCQRRLHPAEEQL